MKKLNIFNKKSTGGGKLSTLLAAFILLLIVTSSTSARADGGYDFVSGILKYQITSETEGSKTVELVGYDGDKPSGEVVIPATVTNGNKEYSVTAIGVWAFDGCTSLTSVTIPEGVTSIGEWAFDGCSSLTSVTIPKSVTSIGEGAFYDCTSLTSVTIPESVTSIGEYAFFKCTSLTSVTIPKSVISIGRDAFYVCTSLTSVTIPESVTSIGEYAFNGCSSLTSVTIPKSVTSIGEDAFYGVRHIINKSKCTDPDHWGAIHEGGIVYGDFVYEDDTKAKLLLYIGKGGDITIPEGVTSIGWGAFEFCESLTSVTIPNSVTAIGDNAFSICTNLTSVTIPKSVTSIGENAFKVVRHIINKSNCTDPDHWGARVENGTVDGDFVYEDDTKAKLLVYVGKGGEVTIPEGVTSIGNETFLNCTSLTSVTIPEGVTSIGEGAFYACTSLTSVTIPKSVTSIGNSAFLRCKSLTSVTIPEGVTSIGEGAFSDCTSLTSVTIPKSVTSIGDYAFAEVKHIINKSNCTDPYPDHWGAFAENGTVVGDFVYENDTKTTLLAYIGKDKEVTIPSGVTSIGHGAFIYCTSLTSIAISEGVTSIGNDAFYECTSVKNVYLYANPDNLTWSEGDCDDFITTPKETTQCHVLAEYLDKYATKFKNEVNVTFVGDVIQLTADDITTSQISDVTYSGTPFTPEIEVKYGDKTLEAGTDYTITYTNNINAGTAKATITGIKLLAFTKEVEFTINPVPVTVTAEAKSKTFGESDPEFTAKIEGLVNNESPDLIKYTFSRTEGENVGEYTITPKGDEKQGNYEVRFVDGKLTINENPNTPVSSIDNNGNNVKVWSYAHTIYIATTPDSQYKIIDLQGRTIKSATTKSSYEEVNINNSGIYVVIINGKSYKVSL